MVHQTETLNSALKNILGRLGGDLYSSRGVRFQFGCCPSDARGLGVCSMSGMKSFIIGALTVAVIALGYLYYQGRQNTVEIRLPNVTIEKK